MREKPKPEKILRDFGLLMGGVLAVFAGVAASKGSSGFAVAAGFLVLAFILTGLAAPLKLEAVHRGWMRFAGVVGEFNSKLILGLIYLVVFTPIRLCFLLTGSDPLKRKFEPRLESYWEDHAPSDGSPRRYEKQY